MQTAFQNLIDAALIDAIRGGCRVLVFPRPMTEPDINGIVEG